MAWALFMQLLPNEQLPRAALRGKTQYQYVDALSGSPRLGQTRL